MVILPDSSAWVHLLRSTGSPIELELVRAADEIAVTEPIALELLSGAAPSELRHLRTELLALRMLPVGGLATFEDAAAIYRRCREAGQTVRSHVDCLIAAVAIRENVAVLHDDRDFDVIARHTDLRVVEV